MKIIKKFLKGLVALILLCVTLLYIFDYDYVLKGIRVVYMTGHTTAYIDDHTYFDNHTIEKGNTTIPWSLHTNYNKVTSTERLNATNDAMGTVAFMIIKDEKIWYEHYAEGYSITSQTNSFSMAKSITSALLGKAIMDGYIKNLDQPIGDFLPKFSDGLAAKVTVGDLSSMASGLNWVEHYTLSLIHI